MASIKKYKTAKGTAWRVQYRSPDGRSRNKQGFPTKTATQAWADPMAVDMRSGDWQPPEQTAVTVGSLIDRLFHISERKPSWQSRLRSVADTQARPRWGAVRATAVRQSQVCDWLAGLEALDHASLDQDGVWDAAMKPMNEPSKRHCLTLLSGAVDLAVKDQVLKANPVSGSPYQRRQRRLSGF